MWLPSAEVGGRRSVRGSAAVAGCALLLTAAAAALAGVIGGPALRAPAFVGLAPGSSRPRGELVAREVRHNGFSQRKFVEEMKKKNEDELHEIITVSRKEMLKYRMDLFRKLKPGRKKKTDGQYRIALAKTYLARMANRKKRRQQYEERQARGPHPDRNRTIDFQEEIAKLGKEFPASASWTHEQQYAAYINYARKGGVPFGSHWPPPKKQKHYNVDPQYVIEPPKPKVEDDLLKEDSGSSGKDSATAAEAFVSGSRRVQTAGQRFAGAAGLGIAFGLAAATAAGRRRRSAAASF